MANEIVVGKETLLRPPQIAMNCSVPPLCPSCPARGFGWFAEQQCNVLHVAFVSIEQAIQADRSIVMGRSRKRAKAKTGIESGLAHGTIAEIEVFAETITLGPGVQADDAGFDIATTPLQALSFRSVRLHGSFDQIAIAAIARTCRRGMCNEPADHIGVVGAVICHLGDGT